MADDVDVQFESVEELQQLFTDATEYVKKLRGLSDEHKLLFYGLFKQAKDGPCKTTRPPFWDFVGRAKWDAWKLVEKMDQQTAMGNYVDKLFCMDPEWEIKNVACDKNSISDPSNKPQKQSMGFAVSTLRCGSPDEVISDANKSIFDWCKDGNVKKMDTFLSKGDDVDAKDDQGMTLLHWACDRGHENVVDYLIQNKADVNQQDDEGQTPLHYAATCEFLTIVKQLLSAKADATLEDTDGCRPDNSTDNKAIMQLLKES